MGQYNASPSSRIVNGSYTWDIYMFRCGEVNPNFLPGVAYDGRAAEMRSGDIVFYIVTFEPIDTAATAQIFEQGLDSFQLK